jgi:hypothetical protein
MSQFSAFYVTFLKRDLARLAEIHGRTDLDLESKSSSPASSPAISCRYVGKAFRRSVFVDETPNHLILIQQSTL